MNSARQSRTPSVSQLSSMWPPHHAVSDVPLLRPPTLKHKSSLHTFAYGMEWNKIGNLYSARGFSEMYRTVLQ